jgi:DNA-directed RNA polymerase subunit RPC12/RpoP
MAFNDWKWVNKEDLPQIGTQCPKCKTGFIEEFSGTSKKGNSYNGVRCDSCKYKWTISFRDNSVSRGTSGVHKRFDEMGDYVKKEVKPRLNKIDDIHKWVEIIKDAMIDLKGK